MRDEDFAALLRALDFNATLEAVDVVTRSYFHRSSLAIRTLQGERDQSRRIARVEEANARGLRAEVRALEKELAAERACDSGSVPEGENSRSEVEGEATQSGAEGNRP